MHARDSLIFDARHPPRHRTTFVVMVAASAHTDPHRRLCPCDRPSSLSPHVIIPDITIIAKLAAGALHQDTSMTRHAWVLWLWDTSPTASRIPSHHLKLTLYPKDIHPNFQHLNPQTPRPQNLRPSSSSLKPSPEK